MARRKSGKDPYRDPETERRHRLWMWARLPAGMIAIAAVALVDSFWPAMVVLAAWYAVWLVWVAGVFEH